MTKSILPALALFALASVPASAQDDGGADTMVPTKGEIKLAKLLEGRVAGEPQTCIRDRFERGFQVIDDTAIVYKIGRTVWVNYTRNPQTLDDDETLVIRRFGSRLCKQDIVTTVDRFAGFYTGNIFLDDFIPYRLPES